MNTKENKYRIKTLKAILNKLNLDKYFQKLVLQKIEIPVLDTYNPVWEYWYPHHRRPYSLVSVFRIKRYGEGGSLVVDVAVIVDDTHPYGTYDRSVYFGKQCVVVVVRTEVANIDFQVGMLDNRPVGLHYSFGDENRFIKEVLQQGLFVFFNFPDSVIHNVLLF